MKFLKYIIAILAVVVIALVLGHGKQIETTSDDTVVQQTVPGARETCYIWNTEANDHATLRIKQVPGSNTVSGSFDWNPAEKDRLAGSFAGTMESVDDAGNRLYTTWWKVQGEGSVNTQELSIKASTTDHIATVGFGEMKDRGDGVYIYADRSAISYAPNLLETDCADQAVEGN